MVDKFLSEDERIVEEFKNFYLTKDRVIKLKKTRGDIDYQDIQLDKITSFDFVRTFNIELVVAGALISIIGAFSTTRIDHPFSLGLVGLGIAAILIALFTTQKEYKIHSSNPDVSLELPDSSEALEFWKEINKEKNQ